jgi:hypothetical protein
MCMNSSSSRSEPSAPGVGVTAVTALILAVGLLAQVAYVEPISLLLMLLSAVLLVVSWQPAARSPLSPWMAVAAQTSASAALLVTVL